MREVEVVRLFTVKVPEDNEVNSVACREFHVRQGGADVTVMTENRAVTRITVREAGTVRTVSGVGVGDTAADLARVYGWSLRKEPHAYEDAPAAYFNVWFPKLKRGMRFESGTDGRVTAIHAGTEAIRYVEGCL